MMAWITIYVLLGLSFTWAVDKAMKEEDPGVKELTNIQRLFISLSWPIGTILVIIILIKNLFNRK